MSTLSLSSKKISFRQMSSLVLLVVILGSCLRSFTAISPSQFLEDEVVIYHTNDIHGNIASEFNEKGELESVGFAFLKNVKKAKPGSLLVDAGDFFQGDPITRFHGGKDFINFMNMVGYDGAALGNHELDRDPNTLIEHVKNCNFPVVSANVVWKSSGLPILKDINGCNGCNFIKEVGGKKIGFFGLLTDEAASIVDVPFRKDITFKNPIQTAKEQVEELKAQSVDLIVAIAHLGMWGEYIKSNELAREVKGIDIIIDGHSHEKRKIIEAGTVIQQAGSQLSHVGALGVSFDNGVPTIKQETIEANIIGNEYAFDREMKEAYEVVAHELDKEMRVVVGYLGCPLYGGEYQQKKLSRIEETNLGCFIAEAVMDEAKKRINEIVLKGVKNIETLRGLKDIKEIKNLKMVAIHNGGAVRGKIDKGYITVRDIENVMPFSNEVALLLVTPSDIYEVLECGVSGLSFSNGPEKCLSGGSGGFPSLAGMKFNYDMSRPAKERVKSVFVLENGTSHEIFKDDSKTKILLAMNRYSCDGGDEYEMPEDIKKIWQGELGIKEILIQYIEKLMIKSGGEIFYPFKPGRTVLCNDSNLFPNYDVNVVVKSKGKPLANTEVDVVVDYRVRCKRTTDENGSFNISNLKSGSHDICVTNGNRSNRTCVSDVAGIQAEPIELRPKNEDKDVKHTVQLIRQVPKEPTKKRARALKSALAAYKRLSAEGRERVDHYKEEKATRNKTRAQIDAVNLRSLYKAS